MKSFRKLKTGDTISCVVEERIENGLLVRYECKNGNKNPAIFRGVLIDKQKPSVKRFIPPLKEKPVLTEEAVESFTQSFQSQHISGKFLRNKKKPSCLVLDEYHLNLNCGLGQRITVSKEAKNPGSKDAAAFVKTQRSKFRLDDMYKKSFNVSAVLPSVPKKSARAPRKPKKPVKIIKENSQLKFVNELRNIAEKEQKELRRPINFFGEKLLESCEILEGSDESLSGLEERNKLLIDEGYRKHQLSQNEVNGLDASAVIVPESKTSSPAETYLSPRTHLKRSFEVQNGNSCSEKLGSQVSAKKLKTDAKESRNGPKTKRRRRKGLVPPLEQVSKEPDGCKYKLRRKRMKKEKPEDAEKPISLFCDEPPLDYVTDEEENVNLEMKKRVSASTRKVAEKILKGKISLLVPNQTNLLARPQESLPRSIPSGSNMMPLYYLVPVSNANNIISNQKSPISASMPDQNDSNLIKPCIPMEDAESIHSQDNNGTNATQESCTNSMNVTETPSNGVPTTMGELSKFIGNNPVFAEKSQKTSNPRNVSNTTVTKSEDANSKDSVKRIDTKGVRKKKTARNTSQAVKKTLNSEEKQVKGPRKAAEYKVTEQQKNPGSFDKTLITQCLENFNNESSSVKNQTSNISNDKAHSLTPSDKKRKTIDPFAYSKISFQRLVNSARKEIVDKEINALKNDSGISPGKESRQGCLNVSDSDNKSADIHIEEVLNDPEEASLSTANALVGNLQNVAAYTESIPTGVSKTTRKKAEVSCGRGVNAGTSGRVSVKSEILDSSSFKISPADLPVSMVQASITNQSKMTGETVPVDNMFSEKERFSNDNGLFACKAKARTVKLEPPDSSPVNVSSEDVLEPTDEAHTHASKYRTHASKTVAVVASNIGSFTTGMKPSNTNAHTANEPEIPEPSFEESGEEVFQSKVLATCDAETPEVEIPAVEIPVVASRSCSSAVMASEKESRSNGRRSIADKVKRKSTGTSVFSVFAGQPLPSRKHIFVSQNLAMLAVKSESSSSSIERRSRKISANNGRESPAETSIREGVLAPFYALSSDKSFSSKQNATRDSQADRSNIAETTDDSLNSTAASKSVKLALVDKSEITNTTVANNSKSSAGGLLKSLYVLESYGETRSTNDRVSVGHTETLCRDMNNHLDQNQLATCENLDSQTSDKEPDISDSSVNIRKDELIRSKPSSSRGKITTSINYAAKNYDVALQVALKNINIEDILKIRTDKTNPGPRNESLALRVALKNLERPSRSGLVSSSGSGLHSGENRGFLEQEQREKRGLLEHEQRENYGLLEKEQINRELQKQEQGENLEVLEQERRDNSGLIEQDKRENRWLPDQGQRENCGLLEQKQRNCRLKSGDKLCTKPSISIRRKNVFKLKISRDSKPSSLSRSGIYNIERKLIESILNQKTNMCCRVEEGMVNQESRKDNEDTTIACNIAQYCKQQTNEKIETSLSNDEIPRCDSSPTYNEESSTSIYCENRNPHYRISRSDQFQRPCISASSQSNVLNQAFSDRTSATGVRLLPESVIINKEPNENSDIESRANPVFCDEGNVGEVTDGKSPIKDASHLHQGTKSQTGRKERRKTVVFRPPKQKVKYPRVFQKPETVRKVCDNYRQKKNFVDSQRNKKPEIDTSRTNLVSDRGKELVEQMLKLNKNIFSYKNQTGKFIEN